jgi:hypothetical protein
MKTVRAFWSNAQMQIDFRGRLHSHHGKCTRKGRIPGDPGPLSVFLIRRTNYRRASTIFRIKEMNYCKKTIPRVVRQHKKNLQKSGVRSHHKILIKTAEMSRKSSLG